MSDHQGASTQIPTLVETPSGMEALLSALADADDISIDIESNGYYNYYERTCILSVSTRNEDWVVDSLALWDEMDGLKGLLCDTGKKILVHGGSYDVLSLKRDFDFTFPRIVDSLLAATLLGFDVLGLAGLVNKYLGVDLPKELQRHNWTLRPLKQEQLRYLGNDTRFLFPIVDRLEALIEEKDLGEEFALECDFLASQAYVERIYDPEESVEKLKDSRRLPAPIRGVLRSLFAWRDEVAKELDVAPFRVIANNVLMNLARNGSTDKNWIADQRGVGRYVLDTGVGRLAEAIKEGQESPFPFKRKKRERSSRKRNYEEIRSLSKAIKAWRNKAADERGIGIQGVLPTPAMKQIIDELPEATEEMADIPRLGARRIERYGAAIIDLIAEHCPSSLREKANAG